MALMTTDKLDFTTLYKKVLVDGGEEFRPTKNTETLLRMQKEFNDFQALAAPEFMNELKSL